MEQWKKCIIYPDRTILEAIQIIDKAGLKIALVIDENNYLLGTVTDGDIRRSILKGFSLDNPVRLTMNTRPRFIRVDDDREKALTIMKNTTLHHIPVLDYDGSLVGLEFIDDLVNQGIRDNWVLLMAGGSGTRLRPLTEACPKPLLNVGGKPVLETILEKFMEQGFKHFYISVNYRADMIIQYFGDGSRWGVEINFLHEDKYLGTAGAIGLLPHKPDQPVLLMNGDILTKVDFRHLLDFQDSQNADATMCVRDYSLQIPYGVVTVNKQRLNSIEEKPVQRFFINAGLYVLHPAVLKYVPAQSYLDIPDLFRRLLAERKEIAVFPIREYWIDIGRINDYKRANMEYAEVFG